MVPWGDGKHAPHCSIREWDVYSHHLGVPGRPAFHIHFEVRAIEFMVQNHAPTESALEGMADEGNGYVVCNACVDHWDLPIRIDTESYEVRLQGSVCESQVELGHASKARSSAADLLILRRLGRTSWCRELETYSSSSQPGPLSASYRRAPIPSLDCHASGVHALFSSFSMNLARY